LNTRNYLLCFLLAAGLGRAAAETVPPKFDEVYQVLRANLQGVSEADLDRAAVKGLIEQFPGQVMMDESGTNATARDPLGKVAVFDGNYAYLRLATVEGDAAGKLAAAYQHLAQTNKAGIKGLVLDLRFADGRDYAAAAAAADCFLNSGQPLLRWGTASASATKKTNAIVVPMAILVNAQTTGAAEALAAALREAGVGLILGGTTAGHASIFKDFPLGNGEKLRVATAPVQLGNGTLLAHGLKPDIAVETSLADEKSYLDDPYKLPHAPVARNSSAAAVTKTNQPGHRSINEAELVRERRAGEPLDDEFMSEDYSASSEPAHPVIGDAPLARALDLLKGLAVLQQNRP